MPEALPTTEGLRERNRRQTLQRISEVGMELFVAKGYEATTLDEIAAAAGISRRTFFYYFKSKDDLLLAYLGAYAEALKMSVRENSTGGAPIDIVRDALMELSTHYEPSKMIATARLMRNSDALGARRQLNYALLEDAIYEALCELWPAKQRRDVLRLVAMASVGTMRLAVEIWLQQDGKRPLARHIRDAFEKLKAEI